MVNKISTRNLHLLGTSRKWCHAITQPKQSYLTLPVDWLYNVHLTIRHLIRLKMVRFFAYVRKCLGFFGFHSNRSLLNARIVFGLLLTWSTVFVSFMFLICEANTFWDYTNGLFTSLATTVVAVIFTMFVIAKPKIFEIVDLFEEMFQQSEWMKSNK